MTVGLTTLLSIAIGVVIRRRAQVCTLPLDHSGRSSAPRPPSACAWFPLQAPGCDLFSNGLCHSPIRSALTSRFPDLNGPHCLYLIAGQSAAGSGMSATPVDYSATELPDRHPLQHRDPDFNNGLVRAFEPELKTSLVYRILLGFA